MHEHDGGAPRRVVRAASRSRRVLQRVDLVTSVVSGNRVRSDLRGLVSEVAKVQSVTRISRLRSAGLRPLREPGLDGPSRSILRKARDLDVVGVLALPPDVGAERVFAGDLVELEVRPFGGLGRGHGLAGASAGVAVDVDDLDDLDRAVDDDGLLDDLRWHGDGHAAIVHGFPTQVSSWDSALGSEVGLDQANAEVLGLDAQTLGDILTLSLVDVRVIVDLGVQGVREDSPESGLRGRGADASSVDALGSADHLINGLAPGVRDRNRDVALDEVSVLHDGGRHGGDVGGRSRHQSATFKFPGLGRSADARDS